MTEPAISLPDIDSTASAPVPPVPTDDAGTARRRRRPFRAIGIGMIVALLGFAGGIAGFYVADEYLADDSSSAADAGLPMLQPSNETSVPDEPSATSTSSGGALTPREVYAKVSPAVVHIDARVTKTDTSFFGIPQEQEATGTGSGFVIDDKGHIVTNAHVVEDAKELSVAFGADGARIPAKLVGEDRSADIAVIKIDPNAKELDGKQLTIARFGDASKMQVGDPVLAIGNPFGLDRTLTTGVVSALQREIPSLNDFQINDVIQTDAAVNPGNSGGPLLNARGEVIGVNSQIQSRGGGFDGIAFAVPSSRVKSVADQLIKSGVVNYAWLGVAGGEITPELVEEFDLPVKEGVLIGSVTEGSPAYDAGLRGGREVRDLSTGETKQEGGDIIVSFDGERLTSMAQLASLVDARRPDDKVKVVFMHDGDRKTATVKLGERPDEVSSPDPASGE